MSKSQHEVVPIEQYDYGDLAGAGYENVKSEDLIIPLLRVLQPLSPQCQSPQAGGMKEARPGMIINISTNQLYDGERGLVGIPCYFDSNFCEYTPRDAGGGFHGFREPTDRLVEDLRRQYGRFGKLPTDAGTELVETKYVYFIFEDPEDPASTFRAVPTFSSTQIKKAQALVSNPIMAPGRNGRSVPLPLFSHYYRLSTKPESNKKGQWYGWSVGLREEPSIKCRLAPTDPRFGEARDFYELLVAGKARAAAPPDLDEAVAADDDIPM